MPVIYENRTVFDVIDELSRNFENTLKKEFKESTATLSFGVSINYHRYPLYESLEVARELLFVNAKNYKDINEKEKNAVSFRFNKHSGKEFEKTFNKESGTYRIFKDILNAKLDTKVLTGVNTKIFRDEITIKEIIKKENKLKNYFQNNFDEDVHKENDYIKIVQNFINTYASEHYETDMIKEIYSILRFIKFIKEEDS
jgi:CRISPR-associated protein Cmr2